MYRGHILYHLDFQRTHWSSLVLFCGSATLLDITFILVFYQTSRSPPTQVTYTSTRARNNLYGDPGDCDDDVHALRLGGLPFIAVCSILLVVPVRADRAVHAAAAVLLGLRGRANVLDDGAVGDVLEGGLGRLGSLDLD